MSRNAPLAEIETDEGVIFRVIKENWSNSKNPTAPAVLQRYDGSAWQEVDRWDRKDKSDAWIIEEAENRINQKTMFQKDGNVKTTNHRVG